MGEVALSTYFLSYQSLIKNPKSASLCPIL
jgi:hypothetical protein